MIRPLRIIADDLTGALDAAAPFASPERPVVVPWLSEPVPAAHFLSVTSETRNADRQEAIERTTRAFHRFGPSPPEALWFKKVDSVLRGYPIAETAALLHTGRFTHCVFAPAFPEMGRVTRGGRQILLSADGPRPVGPSDIVAAFAEEGIAATTVGRLNSTGTTVLVADAETPADLLALVRAHGGLEGVLWAGSRGLAAALAGPSSPESAPPIGLIVVGTNHPVTREQVRILEPFVLRTMAGVGQSFDPERPLLVDPVRDMPDDVATRRALLEILSQLPAGDRRAGLIVVGGDTLSAVLEATRTHVLEVLGEVGPGIPLMQVHGGSLDGRRMVTKSGGFGSPELLWILLVGGASSYA